MASRTDPIGRPPALVERTGVNGSRHVEETGRVSFVDRISLHGRQFNAVERRGNHVVHQQSLCDLDDVTDGAAREVTVSKCREPARCSVEI